VHEEVFRISVEPSRFAGVQAETVRAEVHLVHNRVVRGRLVQATGYQLHGGADAGGAVGTFHNRRSHAQPEAPHFRLRNGQRISYPSQRGCVHPPKTFLTPNTTPNWGRLGVLTPLMGVYVILSYEPKLL